MTFREVELTLPNGFHDVYITAINFDVIARTVALSLSVDISDADQGEPKYRSGRLTASDVELFFIEPPEATYPHRLAGEGMSATGDYQLSGLESKVEQLITRLDDETDRYRFFLNDWNSFIYIAANGVVFDWVTSS